MMVASIQDFAVDKMPFNWFDVALVGILILGLFRGRKHGMSKEFLPLFKWVTLILVCGFFYPMAAELLANTAGLGKVSGFICGYLLLAFAIWILFLVFKRLIGYRMGENNFFGSGEYYLGMSSGMVRFACMLLAGLALLNAPYYSQADIKAQEAYTKRWFGGGVYTGNYFPTVQTAQESIFKKSFIGPYIKDYLGVLLIESTPPETKEAPKPQKTAVVNIQK